MSGRLRLVTIACAGWLLASPAPLEAQWRQAPLVATRVQPAASVSAPRYPSRADYGFRGMLVGVGVAVAMPIAIVASGNGGDCMCGIELPFTIPVLGLLGGVAGLAVWDIRHTPRLEREVLAPMESGLVRYMLIGAGAGGGLGAGAVAAHRCDGCARSQDYVLSVPLGAAAGAIGGAVVYGIVQRTRRERGR